MAFRLTASLSALTSGRTWGDFWISSLSAAWKLKARAAGRVCRANAGGRLLRAEGGETQQESNQRNYGASRAQYDPAKLPVFELITTGSKSATGAIC